MDDFYAELQERALRLGQDKFIAWIKSPVLLLDAPDEGAQSAQTAMTGASQIDSTVLFQESDDDSMSAAGGDDDSDDAPITPNIPSRTAHRLIPRSPSEPITIGRATDCDITIDHPSISKGHAAISRGADGSFQIVDLESKNGVTVNGRRARPNAPTLIRPDDVIRIGGVMARIVYPKPLYALLIGKPVPASLGRRLRDRTYAAFWASEGFAYLAQSLYQMTIVSWVMTHTGSGAVLSAIALFTIVPLVLTLLLGGAVVARLSRAHVITLSLLLRGLIVGVIAFEELHGGLSLWHLYVLAASFGIGEALFLPAAGALLPRIVRREDLHNANALTTISIQSANMLGPALATLFGALGGASLSFAIVAALLLVGALCSLQLSRNTTSSSAAAKVPHKHAAPATLRATVRFMRAEPLLWITSLACALAGSIGFAMTAIVLPVLIKSSMKLDISYFNLCQSLVAVGALGASVWMGRRSRVNRRGLVLYSTVIGAGCVIVLVGFPITIYGIAVAWLLRGAAMVAFGLLWVGTLQQLVPRDMLGHAVSLDAFVSVTLTASAFLVCGALTGVVRTELIFVIGGMIPIVVGLLALSHPRIRAFH